MSDIKLSKTELAALDLLIQDMQDDQAGGPKEANFTETVARVAVAAVRVAARYMPVAAEVAEDVGAKAKTEAATSQLKGAAQAITSGISLEQLIELRRRATQ